MKLDKSRISALYTLIILFFLLVSCGSKGQNANKNVNAEELKELMKQEINLVDVRTRGEYERGRITGAKLIDYRSSNFTELVTQLDKDQPVVLYCASGGRSTGAAKILQDAGFKSIYNYTGGFSDWQRRGEIIEK